MKRSNRILGVVCVLSLVVALNAQQLVNGYRIFTNVVAATVSTPASGSTAIYIDSVTKKLTTKDDAGTVTAYAAGSGNMSTSSANTMSGSGTIDASAASVTGGLLLPKGAGANPTTAAAIAFDTTNNVIQCGDGTNTRHCVEVPLVGGATNTGVAASTTAYTPVTGVSSPNTANTARSVLLPLAGNARQLCVHLRTAQPASGNMVVSLFDETASAATALTTTIAANAAAGFYCDNSNTASITSQHEYVIQFINNATGSSGQIQGTSVLYRY
jgi:hypothetical protein